MSKHANGEEEVLQAVIISDSYNARLRPLTDMRPRCLMPLVNVPLIEYTLEFLASSGVQEIFIFVCAHAEQIKQYINSSTWQAVGLPRIELITSPDSTSVGDVMRRLDEEQKIKGDFILLSGDIVSNLSGAEIVKAHKARREIDKSCIMTMVFRETGCFHRTRSIAECPLVALSGVDNRCLHYARAVQPQSTKLLLDSSMMKSSETIKIRNDLLDCNIDICSADVPALFSENFDYNDMRRDFVHGILTSDLLGKTIHAHVETSKYAARVQDFRSYDAISRDITARWTFPVVLENLDWSSGMYTYQSRNTYRHKGARLSKKVLLSNTVLGNRVEVDNNSCIAFSTIGADCIIGPNCNIVESYLWSNVVVGHNCFIKQALLADNVTIGDNCVIQPGVVLGPGVRLASGVTVLRDIKMTSDGTTDFSSVGQGGSGRPFFDTEVYDESESADDDDHIAEDVSDHSGVLSTFQYRQAGLNFSDLSVSSLGSLQDHEITRRPSVAVSAQSDEGSASLFYDLARADLEAAFKEDHSVDDVMLEMTSLRMREDVGMHEVRVAVLNAILANCENVESGKVNMRLKQLITRWGSLLQRTISANTIKEDCLDLLLSMQRLCSTIHRSNQFVPMTKFMYDDDILSENAILDWFSDSRSSMEEMLRQTRQNASTFVSWLQEAEEASSEGSE